MTAQNDEIDLAALLGPEAAAALSAEAYLDARGLLCPLPVLKARKRLGALASGARLLVAADDPAAVVDVPHFCAEQGHELVATLEGADGVTAYLIRKHGG